MPERHIASEEGDHDKDKQLSDAQQTRRLWHSRTDLLLTASKANISFQVAPGLGLRRAAVGVGTVRNRADCCSADPYAPIAQSLNPLLGERLWKTYC